MQEVLNRYGLIEHLLNDKEYVKEVKEMYELMKYENDRSFLNTIFKQKVKEENTKTALNMYFNINEKWNIPEDTYCLLYQSFLIVLLTEIEIKYPNLND